MHVLCEIHYVRKNADKNPNLKSFWRIEFRRRTRGTRRTRDTINQKLRFYKDRKYRRFLQKDTSKKHLDHWPESIFINHLVYKVSSRYFSPKWNCDWIWTWKWILEWLHKKFGLPGPEPRQIKWKWIKTKDENSKKNTNKPWSTMGQCSVFLTKNNVLLF